LPVRHLHFKATNLTISKMSRYIEIVDYFDISWHFSILKTIYRYFDISRHHYAFFIILRRVVTAVKCLYSVPFDSVLRLFCSCVNTGRTTADTDVLAEWPKWPLNWLTCPRPLRPVSHILLCCWAWLIAVESNNAMGESGQLSWVESIGHYTAITALHVIDKTGQHSRNKRTCFEDFTLHFRRSVCPMHATNTPFTRWS